jgi:hypothetical protein
MAVKRSAELIERVLDEALWLLSSARVLADYGGSEEAAAEWARAAGVQELVACLLPGGHPGAHPGFRNVPPGADRANEGGPSIAGRQGASTMRR